MCINLTRQILKGLNLVVERQLYRASRPVALLGDDDFGDIVGDEVGFGLTGQGLRPAFHGVGLWAGDPELIGTLEVQPHFRARAERLPEAPRGFGGDELSPVAQCVDELQRSAEDAGEVGLCPATRLQLVTQVFGGRKGFCDLQCIHRDPRLMVVDNLDDDDRLLSLRFNANDQAELVIQPKRMLTGPAALELLKMQALKRI